MSSEREIVRFYEKEAFENGILGKVESKSEIKIQKGKMGDEEFKATRDLIECILRSTSW